MDYERRPNNFETSSEENDQPAEKLSDENSGNSRFYECIYCKRGFTNAQALGGHMKIHRKNKVKAKQKGKQLLVSSKWREELTSSRYNYDQKLSSSHEQPQYYAAVPEEMQMNYQYFFPGSNPSFSQGYHLNNYAVPRPEYLRMFEDHEYLNLNMKIDHSHDEDGVSRKPTWEENVVDLELRLG